MTKTSNTINNSFAARAAARTSATCRTSSSGESAQGFQGYGLSILRFRYLVPRMCCCVVVSCLAIMSIEGCLNSTLQQYYWNLLGASQAPWWLGGRRRSSRPSRSRSGSAPAARSAERSPPGADYVTIYDIILCCVTWVCDYGRVG